MTSLLDEVRAALADGRFRPKKRLGQNFLIDPRIIESIARLLDLEPRDEVLEIGPGLGFLTRRLVAAGARVWAVEVDPVLAGYLRQSALAERENFRLVEADILEVEIADLVPGRRVKLVGNLPYSIATPVLFRLFEQRERLSLMVFMVQKEVADRIASGPGSKAYGTLSVWCQVHGRITARLPVAPGAFYPKPKVRSTVLRLELYPEPRVRAEDLPIFRGLVRAAFATRRKTLANNLVQWLRLERGAVEELLGAAGIDPRRRGESLSVDEFIRVARTLKLAGAARSEGTG